MELAHSNPRLVVHLTALHSLLAEMFGAGTEQNLGPTERSLWNHCRSILEDALETEAVLSRSFSSVSTSIDNAWILVVQEIMNDLLHKRLPDNRSAVVFLRLPAHRIFPWH
eukprot:GABV01004395.1.p1 GENE.GABV01004395.1~~GABV01004395.1.p1  ORF type:complete len:111 (-),score=29.51 GABV01004395.1:76-408(-)